LRRLAFMAQEHNIVFSPHTWTNGMAVIANAHLTAGLCQVPFLEFPYDPPEWSFDRRDYMMMQPFVADREGWLNLSNAPGMGYTVDSAQLAKTLLR
jgi:L-alanine-DL-glutamate epimerase-like enolase superfamily enzyme